jgi:hypothetical protein
MDKAILMICGILMGFALGVSVVSHRIRSCELKMSREAEQTKKQIDELTAKGFNPQVLIGAYRAQTNDIKLIHNITN